PPPREEDLGDALVHPVVVPAVRVPDRGLQNVGGSHAQDSREGRYRDGPRGHVATLAVLWRCPRTERRRTTMKARFLTWIAPLSMALTAPVRTTAQPRASEGASSSSWGGAVSIMVVILVVILAIAGAAKLYDHKRKREEEAFAAQAYLADAFLREFGTLP